MYVTSLPPWCLVILSVKPPATQMHPCPEEINLLSFALMDNNTRYSQYIWWIFPFTNEFATVKGRFSPPLTIFCLTLNKLILSFFLLSEAVLEFFFHVFAKYDKKYFECYCQVPSSWKAGLAHKYMSVFSFTLWLDIVLFSTSGLLDFLRSQNDHKS